MKKEHRFLMPVLLSLLLTAAEVFLVVLLIRNLGSVILAAAGDETFAHIFGQLSSARIVSPFFIPFGLWLAFLLYAYRREYCAPRVILLAIPLGLILFVYAIGMQVGAGFFSAFKKGGLTLNFLALCVVGLGVATTCAVRGVFHLSTPVAVGILSGAVTNTPGLGAAQSTYATMSAGAEEIPEAYAAVMSNAYAAAYPLGVLGTILIVLARGNKASTESAIESGTESSAESTKPAPSDPTPRVNASSVAKVFVGIMLGVILGSCPIPIPGLSQPLRLGLAGGPLVVSIMMGAFARNLHMHSLLPSNSLLSMREIGICLFLAAVGLDAGPTFVETMRSGGLQWACFGAAITILPLAIVVLLEINDFKLIPG